MARACVTPADRQREMARDGAGIVTASRRPGRDETARTCVIGTQQIRLMREGPPRGHSRGHPRGKVAASRSEIDISPDVFHDALLSAGQYRGQSYAGKQKVDMESRAGIATEITCAIRAIYSRRRCVSDPTTPDLFLRLSAVIQSITTQLAAGEWQSRRTAPQSGPVRTFSPSHPATPPAHLRRGNRAAAHRNTPLRRSRRIRLAQRQS